MLGKLFGRGDEGAGPFYRPYKKRAANHIYNLLFCDNPALFGSGDDGGALRAVLSDSTDREALETSATTSMRKAACVRLRSTACA